MIEITIASTLALVLTVVAIGYVSLVYLFSCLSTSDVPIGRQAGRQPNPVREAD